MSPATNCASTLRDLKQKIALDPLDLVEYACSYWADHIFTFDDKCASAALDFLKTSLLYWLEACSLIGEVVTAVLAIQKLQKLVVCHCPYPKRRYSNKVPDRYAIPRISQCLARR